MRVRRELVACVLMLTWSHRAAASEEDVVLERASTEMTCSEFRLVRDAHKYYIAGCGQQRTYDCSSGKCVAVAIRDKPAATKKSTTAPDVDDACVAKNIMLDTAYAGCMCLSLMGGTVPVSPPSPPADTCR